MVKMATDVNDAQGASRKQKILKEKSDYECKLKNKLKDNLKNEFMVERKLRLRNWLTFTMQFKSRSYNVVMQADTYI
jgi:hypothetical protein